LPGVRRGVGSQYGERAQNKGGERTDRFHM
jgi:hypothetical protein